MAGCLTGTKPLPRAMLIKTCCMVSLGNDELSLTHCGLVTPYDDRDLGQHWFRKWLVAWWHQAITWTNVDLSSVRSSGIHLSAILQEMHQPSWLRHEWKSLANCITRDPKIIIQGNSCIIPHIPKAQDKWTGITKLSYAISSSCLTHQGSFCVWAQPMRVNMLLYIVTWSLIGCPHIQNDSCSGSSFYIEKHFCLLSNESEHLMKYSYLSADHLHTQVAQNKIGKKFLS